MKLGEKIFVLRKRLGLSQEDLSNSLNVSRQSISNWETGTANPEINKLPLLAETLGVSVDFLLDESCDMTDLDSNIHHEESEKANDPPEPGRQETTSKTNYPSWLDDLPKALKAGIHQYGWIFGIYLTLYGLGFVIFGIIGKAVIGRATASLYTDSKIVVQPDNLPREVVNQITDQLGQDTAGRNFMSIIPNAALIIGIIVIIIGLVLAYSLKQWGQQEKK